MSRKAKKATAALLAALMIGSGTVTGHAETTASSEAFDESQIVLRFGVLSDIHMSGLWNIETSKQKLDRAYTGLELMAGENKLDAVFIDGDITDAMNSSGNMSDSIPKLKQNYIEIGNFRDITLAHFGGSDTKIIYANGNHDTAGGIALDENKKADTTGFYSAKLFQKILSGYQWQTSVPDNASATDQEIADYNKELLKAYDEKSGADYEWFFGADEALGANGLDYGNRHVKVGGYHFLTVEPKDYTASYSEETVTWLDQTLAEITAAEPNKAVFVATHARVKNTIFGSYSSVSTQLVSTLNKYPQVILWGGHEHSALNRELAIWQDGFTAVDAGVVQYLYTADLGYNANSANPVNGKDYVGWAGDEYRKASQGEYVEVDANGNVRIKRLDFYNSDLDGGEVKVIGKPWEILGTNADGRHLSRYTVENRANGNAAPTFAEGAALDVTLNDGIATVTFPAASDDIRVISYFVTVEQDGKETAKQELTSFYYDYADASELNGRTYTASNLQCPTGKSVIKVTAIDDYGATAELSAEVEFQGEVVYPSVEFDLTKLNNNGYSDSSCKGTLTFGETFEGRSNVAKVTKASDNLNSAEQIIMNNHTALPSATLSETPYMVIDYYYAHDAASSKAAAPKMRWRFFIWGNNTSTLIKETSIVTNEWATAVIPLTDEIFAKDDYKIKQYKFDPFGTTALRDMDDNDALYISSIRFTQHMPSEDGAAYVSADGKIAGVDSKVFKTIDAAIKSLGSNGGTVLVKGDVIISDPTELESTGTARSAVTVKGYGDELAARQANRIWFQTTDSGRAAGYNGDITFDEITMKAPVDEAGLFSGGVTVTLGENLLMEKTVKNNSDINASGYKSIAFNFGAYYNQSGKNIMTVNGGSYDAVSSVYSWIPGSANTNVETEYTFNGGTFTSVYGGTRNSAGGVITVGKNTTYNFVGGTFGNVYTGHHQNGKSDGITRFNISGGSFKSISFGSAGGSAEKSQAANTVVKIDGASDKLSAITLYKNDKLTKVNDTDKWIAIVNNAEGGKASFASDLNVDYMLKVYGGKADAVFEGGKLAGFTITADNGSTPVVDGTALTAKNGIYDLSAYEGKTVTISFSSDLPKSRMQNFYWALQNKEKVNVAYLGGSVTWGSGSSDEDTYSWRARVGQWLKDTYGEDKINNINAAIGSTGSYFGSYRVNQDAELESDHTPDLLFIEFAINDIYDTRTKEQVDIDYESIILQAYQANPQIVILPVFTMDISIADNILTKGDENSMFFAEQRAIAAHYGLDTMDVGKELVKVIAAEYEEQGKTLSIYDQYDSGTIWRKYITDACHPNDNGYKYYADTVIKYLDSQLNPAFAAVSPDEHADVVLPEPYCKPLGLENHLKLNGHYISFKDAGFTKENFYGWETVYIDGESGVGDSNGSIITSYNESTFAFTFKGTAVGFYNHGKPTSGKINFKVTATDDPSVTYSGATDLRKNYSVGLSYPGELITGLEDREWKVECIMKDGGDGIVADLRFIYINGDVSTVKPCAAPESYIPNLKPEWASVEFDLTTLNNNGYSADTCKGTLTHDETFDGRTGVSKLTKAADNMNSADEIIMNNTTALPNADLTQTPYMVIDYYYAHDTASDKAAATKMRWRFFIKAGNNDLIAKEQELVTNEWTTAVIPLTDADFAKDGNKIKQYKFDPFGTTITRDLDDNDTLYISGIRFVHDIPTVKTETGVAYVSSDGYIENVGAKISTSIADAMKTLGTNGGTIRVYGDTIITDAAQIEEAGEAREPVTVKGYGDELAARQANRIWFQKTGTVRETSFNGDITYDEITLKAPMDEAGIRATKMLTLGSNVLVEKTVKNNSSINAAGTKDISLNFGASYEQSGTNTVTVNGGAYDAVSAVYNWNPGNVDTDIETEYTFNGGSFRWVLGGTRNSAGGVYAVKGDTTYNFVGGLFDKAYTGHYVNGKSEGITRFNVSGGTFTNGIVFGSAGATNSVVAKSQAADTVVKIDGASDKLTAITLYKNDKLTKVNDTDKWIAIVNNAEGGKASFASDLNVDYMLKVYGGKADAVFENGKLAGFTIVSDNGNAPIVNGTVLSAENGMYDLSAYEGKSTEIYFNELAVDPNYSADGDQSNKLTVRGAQLRYTNGTFDLRFVSIMGRTLLNNAKVKAPETSEDTALGYGFVILPVELLGENELTKETAKAYTVPAVKTFRDSADEDHIEYTVCVTGIAQENFNRYYAVRPYITYTDDYGVQRTVYGECYKGASLYSVASMVSESDPLYNEIKENILDKVK